MLINFNTYLKRETILLGGLFNMNRISLYGTYTDDDGNVSVIPVELDEDGNLKAILSSEDITIGDIKLKNIAGDEINPAKEDGNLSSIKGKTDNIPSDPAKESGKLTSIDSTLTSIKGKTDNIPTSPATDGSITAGLQLRNNAGTPVKINPATEDTLGNIKTGTDKIFTLADLETYLGTTGIKIASGQITGFALESGGNLTAILTALGLTLKTQEQSPLTGFATSAKQSPPTSPLAADQTGATGDTNVVTVTQAGILGASLYNPSTSITMYVWFGAAPSAGSQIVLPPLASKDVQFKVAVGNMQYKSSAIGGTLIYELDG